MLEPEEVNVEVVHIPNRSPDYAELDKILDESPSVRRWLKRLGDSKQYSKQYTDSM